ncbi:MAG TPA: ATP-binding protein [Thermoanaerobaculia bacterium]|jgi:PAS domain S-box-containing protein|nr:ATP-binding protein [Thermoanaerobaculia bacterium]
MHSLPWALVSIALFAMAALIFRRQHASRVAVLFCAMIVLVAIWHAAFAAMFATHDQKFAELYGRISLAAIALLPAAIYEFTTTALRLTNRNALLRTLWILSFVFAAISVFSSELVAGVTQHPWGWYPIAGRLFMLFLAYFFATLVAHLVEGILEFRRSNDPKRRRRVAKMMTGFLIVYASSVDFLPMLGVDFRPLGYLPVLAFIVFAFGTIRRHRFQTITAARAAREILETMADALFVLDADGRIRVINGAVTTLLGFTQADILGRSIDTLEPITPDTTISRTLNDLAHRGAIRDQERVFRHHDGSSIDVSVSISPVSEENVERGAVVIARDIRARKHAEAELRSTMKRLELSNRELEDFAHIASHDLQEPLRKIQAFGDLLESKHGASLPPQAVDYIERMRGAAKRMQVLINDLLAFSRVATKGQPFIRVDLEHIAHEVAHDLEMRVSEAGGHIDIGDLPNIDADPLQMRQLFQNLAGNALKFQRTEVAPIVKIDGVAEGEMCRIRVADNGIGFDEKYAERIFTMFERLHGRGKYEGTGIGLAICRRIAERHGGTVIARSTPGEGSTFIVTLPIRQGDATNGSRQTNHHPAGG